MLVNIQALIEEAKCSEALRQLRWPDGVRCPACSAAEIAKRGVHTHPAHRQRYPCRAGGQPFDDVTDTVLEGHHQPLRTWVWCRDFRGLNLSSQQMAAALDWHPDDAHDRTSPLREGIEVKNSRSPSAVTLNSTKGM